MNTFKDIKNNFDIIILYETYKCGLKYLVH